MEQAACSKHAVETKLLTSNVLLKCWYSNCISNDKESFSLYCDFFSSTFAPTNLLFLADLQSDNPNLVIISSSVFHSENYVKLHQTGKNVTNCKSSKSSPSGSQTMPCCQFYHSVTLLFHYILNNNYKTSTTIHTFLL